MSLSRDDILKVQDIQIEEVDVPEWGGSVFVKGMTGTERESFEKTIMDQRGKTSVVNMDNFRAKLVVYSTCDEKGNLIFKNSDVAALSEKSAAPLVRIAEVATRLSAIGKQDIEELTEELEANPTDGSTSA